MYELPGLPPGFIYADINAGVDFERARERLEAKAGKAYRAYWRARHDPQAAPEAAQELQDVYVQANAAAKRLRADDIGGIAAVLSE